MASKKIDIASLNQHGSSLINSPAMWVNLFLSFILLQIVSTSGEMIKYAVAPYALYLVWNEKPANYPALIILTTAGTTLTFFIFLLTIVASIRNWSTLKHMKFGWVFVLLISVSPVLVWQFYQRIQDLNMSFIESITPLTYFLGVFPAFYGAILSTKFRIKDVRIILFVIILAYLFNTAISYFRTVEVSSFRFSILGNTLLLASFLASLLSIKFRKLVPNYLFVGGMLLLVLVIIGIIQIKFHLLLAVVIAILILIFYYRDNKFALNSLIRPRVIIFIVAFTFIAISLTTSNTVLNRISLNEEIDYANFARYPEYMMNKLFADRAVIWKSVWNHITNNDMLLPPLTSDQLFHEVVFLSGHTADTDIAAHNLMLEVIKNLGWIVGGIVLIVVYFFLLRAGRFLTHSAGNISTVILTSILLGVGISTAITGNFLLSANFSFPYMSMLGLLSGFAHIYQDNSNKKQSIL